MVLTAQAALESEAERRFGSRPHRLTPVSGGDINEAFRVDMPDGRTLFAKFNRHPPPRLFESEAHGLALLRDAIDAASEAPGPRMVVPTPLHHFERGLFTSWLDLRPHALGADFGWALAGLHLAAPPRARVSQVPRYGLGSETPAAIATLPQSERSRENWVDFFLHERLLVQLELPPARRLVDPALRRAFDVLFERLGDFLPRAPRPSLLHGDLWGGNAGQCPQGPAIFDPAVSVGHAEVDLAMMDLFGGFDDSVWRAHRELCPEEPGQEQRLALYQLYPLLVHVNLFGASYLSGVRTRLERFV